MKRETMQRVSLGLSAVVIFGSLLLLWVVVIHLFHIPPYMLPTPAQVTIAAISRHTSLLTSLEITAAAAAGGLLASML
jgi:NitT/TauT family transport system permease protein